MNGQHRIIRAHLSSMSPRRAVEYVRSFQLRPDEEAVLVECDVRGMSCIQAEEKLHLTLEAIKRRRKSAYSKIADEINHRTEEGRD